MRRVLLTFALVMAVAVVASAQNETATLTGRVTDQTGSVLVGATVAVTNQATGVERVTVTNDAGRYVVAGLQPGTYRMVVTLDGFAQIVKTDVVLRVQDTVAENFELRVGSLSESTTVVASPVRLSTGSAAVSTSIDQVFVENLPLNGRTIQSLLALSPGMITTQTGDVGQISSDGLRTSMNSFYIDGVSANIGVSLAAGQAGYAGSGLGGFSALGTTNNLVSVDALQEFTVQTSTFSPEYGRQPGAQISMTTKSGTNSFRGSAFEYHRNDSMDAADWFVINRNLVKPESSTNDFGGTLGGPIVKNKTFFFLSYEGLRLLLPNTMTRNVMATWLRAQAHPALKPYIDATPAPTGPDNPTTGLATFTAAYSDPSELNATSLRLDQTVGGRATAFARYNYSPSWSIAHTSPYNSSETWMRTQTLTAGATMIFSPRLTNVARFNWSQNRGRSAFIDTDFPGTVPLPDSAKAIAGMDPSVSRGLLTLVNGAAGGLFGYTGNNTSTQYNVTNTVTWLRGNHTVRVGLDYRHFAPVIRPPQNDMTAVFTTPASVITGVATAVTAARYRESGYTYNNVSLFLQDAWRISDRLSVDYGLRWDVNPPPTIDPAPMLVNGAPNFSTATLGEKGQKPYETRWTNVAPRLGIVYKLRASPSWETIVRGGGGLFYDVGAGSPATGAAALYPHLNIISFSNHPFPFAPIVVPEPSMTPPYPATSYLVRYDGYVTPRVYQWNAAIEQALGRNNRITLTYTGNAGRRLLRRSNPTNRAYNNPLFAPTASFFTSTNLPGKGDESDYKALKAQFRHQSKSLNVMLNYTLAKAMDTNGSDTQPVAIADPGYLGWLQPEGDYAYSIFDRRHSFKAAATWSLPGIGQAGVLHALTSNWAMHWVVQAESARPLNVAYVWTMLASGQSYSLRPDLVSGQPIWISDANEPLGKRLNPAAFTPLSNPASRAGNLPRNGIRGFGYWQADAGIDRQFRLPRHIKMRVKAEVFNVFNVANFANPNTILGSLNTAGTFSPFAPFGRSTQMLNRGTTSSQQSNDYVNAVYAIGGPRAVQLSVRLTF